MAWRSHGKTNESLVANMKKNGLVTSTKVEAALLAVDRANYCPSHPYQDSPQRIGHWATISAPHMHAHCLEHTEQQLQPGASVLDVGCGSGYLVAAFAQMVGPSGRVVGVDHIPELVELSVKNMRKADGHLLDSGRCSLVCGDGREGFAASAPYDVIHVGAAAPVVPDALLKQLRRGGRMIIPVGPQGGSQALEQYDKGHDGTITRTRLFGVRYVPLTSIDDPYYS